MLNVKKMLETAWSEFKSDYKNAAKCEEEFAENGRKRTAKKYAYVPWNEFDARFVFARKIERLYAKAGSKAEVHINWDISKWVNPSKVYLQALKKALPKNSQFDLLISSPYSTQSGRPTFDALMEFKMYRGQQDFHPWERLEAQAKALMKVKNIKEIKVTKEVAVALILARKGLSRLRWNEILKNLKKYEDKGLILLEFNTQKDA